MSASYILVDCPHCGGIGEQEVAATATARLLKPCTYCGGRGEMEQDIDREAQAGDERLKVEEEDKP